MFTLALRKRFIAYHPAHHPDAEHPIQSHLFVLEVMLEAETLDEMGQVFDLDVLESEVVDILKVYANKDLHQTPAFAQRPFTLEAFAQILGDALNESLYAPHLTALSVRLWCDERAWALYDIER